MCPDSLNGPPLFLIAWLPWLPSSTTACKNGIAYHDVKRFKYVWICTEMIV